MSARTHPTPASQGERAVRPPPWTDAERDIIRGLRAQGVRYSDVMGYVHLFPGRKPYALRQQYGVLFGRRGVRDRAYVRRSESVRDLQRLLKARTTVEVIADHNEVLRHERPRTRGDCLPGGCNGARPCPWVSCGYHLYLDVRETGAIGYPHASRELWELADTCALDVAERSDGARGLSTDAEHALDEVGAALNLARERVRQLADGALARGVEALSPRDAQRVRDALRSIDGLDPDVHAPTGSALTAPRVVRYLPVVQAAPPERPVLDADARALAATQAARLDPRTWLRRAAARRSA